MYFNPIKRSLLTKKKNTYISTCNNNKIIKSLEHQNRKFFSLLSRVCFYLISSALVDRHVPLQLSTVREAVAALWTVEALLGLLVPVLDVLLQGAVTLVASCAVWTGEQLRE